MYQVRNITRDKNLHGDSRLMSTRRTFLKRPGNNPRQATKEQIVELYKMAYSG